MANPSPEWTRASAQTLACVLEVSMFSRRFFSVCLLATLSTLAVAQVPPGELIDVPGSKTAVILAHGRAQGPDGQVVGPLRRSISKDAGFTTLSLQLPVLATADYLAYAATFPDAYKTIQAAIEYLSKEKGVSRIYVLGYSMGARMTTAFLASTDVTSVSGYIGVGILEGGGDLLDANLNIRKLKVPILDLYADSTPLDLRSAENRNSLVGPQYKQVRFAGANHSFKGYETELSREIVAWLKSQCAEQEQLRANPTLEPTRTGIALGPPSGMVHHPSSGRSAIPALAPQIKGSPQIRNVCHPGSLR